MTADRPSSDTDSAGRGSETALTLTATPERHLIRHSGSHRHVVFGIKVAEHSQPTRADRYPLRIGLVVDRSGSMSGDKLNTAKQAALAVLDRLDERDEASVVVYDDAIDVVQPLVPVTDQLKREIRAKLARVEARAMTALHEGWLTGCKTLVSEPDAPGDSRVARCFLLTDGLANVGLSDPEQLAQQAAGVRERTGVSTSTFGIGEDYNESLLGPMAMAGGGQFHNLRALQDILNTFVGEIGSLLTVAARGVTLEIGVEAGVTTEVVSAYWASPSRDARTTRVAIGDLLASEERQVVARFGFRPGSSGASVVRARLTWSADGEDCSSPWQEVTFSYAGHSECDAERRDSGAMRLVGRHHAERVKLQATELARGGDPDRAINALSKVEQRIKEYAGADRELAAVLYELDELKREIAERRLSSLSAKEHHFQSRRLSRGQKDYR